MPRRLGDLDSEHAVGGLGGDVVLLQYLGDQGVRLGYSGAAPRQVPYPTPGFDLREPARYPGHQALECLLPAGSVYVLARGHRLIFTCRYK